MAFTDPNGHIFVTGEVITAANFKTYVSDDIVAIRNGLTCSAGKNTTPAIPTNAWTTVLYETDTWDNANIHNTGANTDRMVAVTAGVWEAQASALWQVPPGAVATYNEIRLVVNGALVIELVNDFNGAVIQLSHEIVREWKVAANDYFTAQVIQYSGANLNLLASTARLKFIGAGV